MSINLLYRKTYLLLLMVFICSMVNPQNVIQEEPPEIISSSCGNAVLNYLKTNYFSQSNANIELSGYEVTLLEMLSASKGLQSDAQAVFVSDADLDNVPTPCILHLSTNHYILLLDHQDGNFKIYDPAAVHIKSVSNSYMAQFNSKKAIVFSNEHTLVLLSDADLENTAGAYSHEYPPPNQTEDGSQRGRSCRNRPQGECRNNRGGSPLISFNPIILNLVVEDMPMWYEAGVGQDILLDLVYNSNDQQEISGGAPSPTQYYPLGKRWSFSYASFYSIQSADAILLIMPDGARETFTFTGNSSTPAHSNNFNTFERYTVIGGYGYALTIKSTKMIYRYDNTFHHKLTSIEDKNGNVVTLNYNVAYNLESITDANGRSVEFTLNFAGRITKATDPLGRTAIFEYGYTNDEFLVGITDMGGYASTLDYESVQIVTQSGYVWQPQIVSITTPTGTSDIVWTATGVIGPNQLAFYWTFINPNGMSSRTYFAYGGATTGVITTYDNNGNFDVTYVDLPNYRITHIVKPDPSASIFYGYNANGNLNSVTTGYFQEQFVYDEDGNITQFMNPSGKTTMFSYDENDNMETITDPMNNTIAFEYDNNDNVTSMVTPVSAEYYTWYPDGNLHTYTDGNSNLLTFNYDDFGYLTEIDYPSGNPTTIVNDDLGRAISSTDQGITLEYEYDGLNQITWIDYPDATSDQYVYDFQNLVETIDRGKRKINFAYDGMNQVLSVQGPQGYLNLERDGNGNVTRFSINAQNTYYTYDGMNRLIAETNPDGTTKQYTYNEIGNVLTRIDEKGILTTYSYYFDLLTHIDYADNTPDVSFNYNANGMITQMSDGIGTTSYYYDDGGRLIGNTGSGQDDDFTYTWDSAFNRKTMVVDGLAVDYSFDDLNRLTQVASNFAGATYTYDDNSNLIKTEFGNDSYTDYTWDDLNRLASLYNKKSSGETISGFNYLINESTLLEQITDHRGIISNYEYDYSYQLINERVINQEGKTLWHNKFTYDNMGNRITLHKNGVSDHYTYNVNNQLTSLTTTSINVSGIVDGDSASNVYVEDMKAKTTYLGSNMLAFEAFDIPVSRGNDTIQLYARVNDVLATVGDSSKFICTTNTLPNEQINIYLFTDVENVDPENINTIYIKKDLIYYEYDENGNLMQRRSPADTMNYHYDAENRLTRIDLPGGDYEEYVYDGLGQRVKTMKNGNLFKSYVYDNIFEAVAIRDSENNTQFISRGLDYLGGIGGLVGAYDETNGNFTNYFNHRGDLINSTDSDEGIVFSGEYDAFGNMMALSGTQSTDFGFSSKEFDATSGLYNFGGRYYSTVENRWMTRDPAGYEAGFNLYAFVGNNPAMSVDPFGFCEIPADLKKDLKVIGDAVNNIKGDVTKEVVLNIIENMAKTGKISPNFMSRIGGVTRAGGVIIGLGLTFLSPEGAEAMRGAIQLVQGLKREQEMVEELELLPCGQDLRPNLRKAGRAAGRLNRGLKSLPGVGWLFKTKNDR